MILSLNSFCSWSAALARSTMNREPTVPACADVWARSHYKSGINLRSSPKDANLAVIMLYTLLEVSKGYSSRGCTKDIG